MKLGVVVPQGYLGEYAGWEATRAWSRTVALTQGAERLGFDSAWIYDHLTTTPVPLDAPVFESFTAITALAASTRRIRLGQLVLCAPFRNAALTAKMIATADVASGGRMELGLGAGWKQDEWDPFGYRFPDAPERLGILSDTLEIMTRLLGPGEARATWDGRFASAREAINLPRGHTRPRVPIVVGGNGRNVTWRLAARHADELNLNLMTVAEVAAALPVVRERCEESGRDPDSLRISVQLRGPIVGKPGGDRVERLAGYRELGLDRAMVAMQVEAVTDDEALPALADDARAAGIALADATAG